MQAFCFFLFWNSHQFTGCIIHRTGNSMSTEKIMISLTGQNQGRELFEACDLNSLIKLLCKFHNPDLGYCIQFFLCSSGSLTNSERIKVMKKHRTKTICLEKETWNFIITS